MEEKAASVPPAAPPLAVKSAAMALIKSVSPVAHVIAYNSAWASVIFFGCGLLWEKGFKDSLAMAASAPKYYAISCGVHCLLTTLLKAIRVKDKDKDDDDGMIAAAAGCGVGVFQAAFLGSPFDPAESCFGMGAISIMDQSRLPLPKLFALSMGVPTYVSKSFNLSISSIITTVFHRTIEAAALGVIYGYASDLSNKNGVPDSTQLADYYAKAVAIGIGINTTIHLLLQKIRGKDDVINAGLAGCFVGLYRHQVPSGPTNPLLSGCIGYGFCSAVIDRLGKFEFALPYDPEEEVPAVATVLPPFILPFPRNVKDDFFAFCESVREHNKSSQ